MDEPSLTRGETFGFRFAPAYRWAGRVFGINERTAHVTVTDHDLRARFGPWLVRTPLANIHETSITGPYRFLKTAGPARLSLADRGLTLATNGERGLCLTLRSAVPGIEPSGWLRHPNLTMTVADCEGLARLIDATLQR